MISERLHGRVSAASKLDEVGLQETVPKRLRGRGMTRLRKGIAEGCRQPSETGSHGKVPERLRKPFGRTPRDQTQNTLEGGEWLLNAVKPDIVLALKPLPVHLPVHLPEALPALEGECVLWDVLYVCVPPRLRGAGAFIRQAHSTPGCFVCLRGCFGGSLRSLYQPIARSFRTTIPVTQSSRGYRPSTPSELAGSTRSFGCLATRQVAPPCFCFVSVLFPASWFGASQVYTSGPEGKELPCGDSSLPSGVRPCATATAPNRPPFISFPTFPCCTKSNFSTVT